MKTYKVIVDEYGVISWYNEQGKLHCEHGPAAEYANGTKFWYQNDKLHRLDGPAVEYYHGSKYWFIEDKEYTEADFKKKVEELKNPKPSFDGKVVTIEGKQYKLTEI